MIKSLKDKLDQDPWITYAVLSSLFCVLFFISLWVNDRFWLNDFKVYYNACSAMLNGGPVYGVYHALGSGLYKYTPVCLFPFVPFTYLPYNVAATLFFVLVSTAVVAVPIYTSRICNRYFGLNPCAMCWIMFLLIIAVHLERELHLANINLMLLGAIMWALHSILKGKEIRAGVVLGIVLLFKLHFLILIPLLVLRKKWKALGASVLVFAAGMALPLLVLDTDKALGLTRGWTHALQLHTGSVELSGNTIFHWLDVTIGTVWADFPSQLFTVALVAGLVFLWVLSHFKQEKEQPKKRDDHFVAEWFVLLAVIPNLVITDTEHFLLSIPIIFTCLIRLRRLSMPNAYRALIIAGLFLYALNWGDLWGDYSVWITENGILGLGNLLLILAFVLIKEKPLEQQAEKEAVA